MRGSPPSCRRSNGNRARTEGLRGEGKGAIRKGGLFVVEDSGPIPLGYSIWTNPAEIVRMRGVASSASRPERSEAK